MSNNTNNSTLKNSTKPIQNSNAAVQGSKTKLKKYVNEFVTSVNALDTNNNSFTQLTAWLTWGDDNKPNFLTNYTQNRVAFLHYCSKLLEQNYHFLESNNQLQNLSNKMEKFRKSINSLIHFILEHEKFREKLTRIINDKQLPDYWVNYYGQANNDKSPQNLLKKICGDALNNDFKNKLKACFVLIISLSLASIYESINV